MWTANSKKVSEELKKKIMIHAAAIRPYVLEENQGKDGFLAGSRFNSDEQVFQAFCMANIKYGQYVANSFDLPQLVEKALISAGECDYYYAYEKEY